MKSVTRMHETDAGELAQHAEAIDKAMARVREAEQHAEQADRRAQSAHEAIRVRRLELGRALASARKCFPKASRNAKGWTDFLSVRRLTLEQAQDAMKYAGFVDETLAGASVDDPANLPTMHEAGIDNRPRDDQESEDPEEDTVDRDTWCTPKWITDAIGEFDLDPCANERSTVRSTTRFDLDLGIDGLAHAEDVKATWRVFCNPPYSDVQPWITAYGRTRFCFLLKLDTSTRWFADLIERTQLILIPRLTRIQFVAPPGVPPKKALANQFPHALFYARTEDATPEIRALCYHWRVSKLAGDCAQPNPAALHLVRM